MDFNAFHFDPRVAAGIAAAGYTIPTPVQIQALPPVLEGRDVMGLAQTGTGKTAAFVLPILQRLLGGTRGGVRALVLAPTRELAEQIHNEFKLLGSRTGVRSTTAYGGMNINRQIDALRRGTDVVVACPGRLLDHIGRRTVDLARVDVLVVDEADQMLDMGFLPDVRRILKHLPQRRQSLMFSATMPAAIESLAREILVDPVAVRVGDRTAARTVSHALYPVAGHLKTPLLLRLLQGTETGSVLVFTRTKHRAKRLGERLARAGYPSASLQGNLSQNRRQEALGGFRDGTFRILVATDIAARGIDVAGVSHVINYDVPSTPEAYVHRIGRTGRAARSGDAFTLVTDEDDAMVRAIDRVIGRRVERRTVSGFDYGSPAPRRDTEFARPPRPPARRRPSVARDAGSAGAAAGRRRRRPAPAGR